MTRKNYSQTKFVELRLHRSLPLAVRAIYAALLSPARVLSNRSLFPSKPNDLAPLPPRCSYCLAPLSGLPPDPLLRASGLPCVTISCERWFALGVEICCLPSTCLRFFLCLSWLCSAGTVCLELSCNCRSWGTASISFLWLVFAEPESMSDFENPIIEFWGQEPVIEYFTTLGVVTELLSA